LRGRAFTGDEKAGNVLLQRGGTMPRLRKYVATNANPGSKL
jgi:hypothetical protein